MKLNPSTWHWPTTVGKAAETKAHFRRVRRQHRNARNAQKSESALLYRNFVARTTVAINFCNRVIERNQRWNKVDAHLAHQTQLAAS